MAWALGREGMAIRNRDGHRRRGLKPLTRPMKEVLNRAGPYLAIGRGVNVVDVLLQDTAVRARSLKTGAQKSVYAVLGGDPQKSMVIHGKRSHRNIV